MPNPYYIGLSAAQLRVNLSQDIGTISSLSDGTTTLNGISNLTVSGGTLTGTAPNAVLTVGGGGSSNVEPPSHPSSPFATNDEFEGTSLDPKWTQVNMGGTTLTFDHGAAIFHNTGGGQPVAIVQAVPAGAWVYQVRTKRFWSNTGSSGTGVGFMLYNSGTTKNINIMMDDASGPFVGYNFTNPTTFASTIFTGQTWSTTLPTGFNYDNDWTWMRLTYNGTNTYSLSASWSGYEATFVPIGTSLTWDNTFIGSTTHIGPIFNNNATGGYGIYDHFRRIS